MVSNPLVAAAPQLQDVLDALDEERSFEVAIKRRARTAGERLSELWEEVRKET